MENFATRYVPELDGLRGIAILSVIVHHQLTPFSLRGGFLGVDLFFVLSGFLITGLLKSEIDRTNRISLKNFYVRRLLRLGPALFAYLCACLAVAAHIQSISMARQLKLILFAIVYATNWRMAFGWDTALDPTSIIWSLSIEEQFYLVWPLVFFACAALGVRRRFIALGLAIVITTILVHRYRLLISGSDLTRLYYGTDTRADALLTGCLVALVPASILNLKTKKWFVGAGVLAAVCLAYLIWRIDFGSPFLYAGGFTLVAVICGLLVFTAANSQSRFFSHVLGFQPLCWIGQISYGLYLWHWLVVRHTSFYYLGKWEPWMRLGLSLAIASLSFYVLERPFNKLKKRFGARPEDSSQERSQTTGRQIPTLVRPLSKPQPVAEVPSA